MATQPKKLSFLLILVTVAIFVPSGVAQVPPFQPISGLPSNITIPGLLPGLQPGKGFPGLLPDLLPPFQPGKGAPGLLPNLTIPGLLPLLQPGRGLPGLLPNLTIPGLLPLLQPGKGLPGLLPNLTIPGLLPFLQPGRGLPGLLPNLTIPGLLPLLQPGKGLPGLLPNLTIPGLLPWLQPGIGIPSLLPQLKIVNGQLAIDTQALKCWQSLSNIRGCVLDIVGSLYNGQIGRIGSACCIAITRTRESCLPPLFPFNPFFPPLLKASCSAPGGLRNNTFNKIQFPELLPPENAIEIAECGSSIVKVPECVVQVFISLATGQFQGISPTCCNAISQIQDKCWPKLFPFNPFFPPLMKASCHGSASSPTN